MKVKNEVYLIFKTLNTRETVDDINGKPLQAIKVFSLSIHYLWQHFLKALQTQTTGVKETDIKYVITVPAIWDDKAKQFMREAAIQVPYWLTFVSIRLFMQIYSLTKQKRK